MKKYIAVMILLSLSAVGFAQVGVSEDYMNPQHPVTLYPGWNQVTGDVFKNMQTDCDFTSYATRIYGYSDPDGWKEYTIADMNLRSPLTGYFVTVPEKCTINYNSTGMLETITLRKGWNIISGYRTTTLTYWYAIISAEGVTNYIKVPCNFYPVVFTWTPEHVYDQDLIHVIKDNYGDKEKEYWFYLSPTKAYWIYIYDEYCEFSASL